MAALPPLDLITLIGMWTATLLYGANIIVCSECVYVLFRRYPRQNVHMTLLCTTIFLFCLSTLHISFGLRALIEGFIYAPANGGDEASIASTLYFARESNRWDTTKNLLYCFNVTTQDAVLIWRLYSVWGNNIKIAIIPIILELVHTGTGFITPVLFMNPSTTIFDKTARTWAIVPWTMELAVNVGSTTLIAYRLMWQDRRMRQVTSARMGYSSTVLTIVESGAIFTSLTIAIVGLYLSNNPAFLGVIDVSTQMATLSPTMILARVGLGMTHGSRKRQNVTTVTTGPTLAFRGETTYPEPLHINVTHVHETVGTGITGTTVDYAMEDIKGDVKPGEP